MNDGSNGRHTSADMSEFKKKNQFREIEIGYIIGNVKKTDNDSSEA